MNNKLKIDFNYSTNAELQEYLDDLSLMLYGVSYYNLYFLNKNPYDFSSGNCLIIN